MHFSGIRRLFNWWRSSCGRGDPCCRLIGPCFRDFYLFRLFRLEGILVACILGVCSFLLTGFTGGMWIGLVYRWGISSFWGCWTNSILLFVRRSSGFWRIFGRLQKKFSRRLCSAISLAFRYQLYVLHAKAHPLRNTDT